MDIVTRGVEAFVHQGACPTHAVVIDGHGKPTFLVPQCLPDDNVKSCFSGLTAETANERHAVAVVFLAETWVSGDNWDGVTPVSQCADRREALMATVEIGAEAVVFLWPILRDDTSVRLGECKQLDAELATGRFVGLLRRQDPNELRRRGDAGRLERLRRRPASRRPGQPPRDDRGCRSGTRGRRPAVVYRALGTERVPSGQPRVRPA